MKNLGEVKTLSGIKSEFQADFIEALNGDNKEAVANSISDFADAVQEAVLAEAEEQTESKLDAQAMQARGLRPLLSTEKKWYESAIAKMKTGEKAMSGVSLIDETIPTTIIDRIFEDIVAEHPLLNAIKFENTGALAHMFLSKTDGKAFWGELTGAITEEIEAEFEFIKLTSAKLSAFIPVSNAMLDLGPTWLDKYVRTILMEALAMGLEDGIVNGSSKDSPIGMTRKLSGATDGVYPKKAVTNITAFDTVTIGAILGRLSKNAYNGKSRKIQELLLVVNPTDFYTKVYPATTVRGADGTYKDNVFPYKANIVESAAVAEGEIVMGIAGKYYMGVGTAKGGKLEHSDHTKFLEDQRLYRIKLYGMGQAMDENAFEVLGISALEPASLEVKVIERV